MRPGSIACFGRDPIALAERRAGTAAAVEHKARGDAVPASPRSSAIGCSPGREAA
jgi:hypothetical protein